jgi:hypothetical protein
LAFTASSMTQLSDSDAGITASAFKARNSVRGDRHKFRVPVVSSRCVVRITAEKCNAEQIRRSITTRLMRFPRPERSSRREPFGGNELRRACSLEVFAFREKAKKSWTGYAGFRVDRTTRVSVLPGCSITRVSTTPIRFQSLRGAVLLLLLPPLSRRCSTDYVAAWRTRK